jgi:hypothetical protein
MFGIGGKYRGVPMLLMHNLKIFRQEGKRDIMFYFPKEKNDSWYVITENIFINKVNPKKSK